MVGDGKSGSITDDDARRQRVRGDTREDTGVGRHMSSGACVHVPVPAARVVAWGRGGVEGS